jgi:hypothetical protein
VNAAATFTAVPGLVWGVLLGALLTIIAVLLFHWGTARRLTQQQRFERDERAAERTAVLRREVYLHAAQELIKANDYLLTIPQLDARQPMQGLQGFLASVAQVQLVCDVRTAQLVGELAAMYPELALKAYGKARPIQDLQVAIEASDDACTRAQAEVQRVLAAMSRLSEGTPESGQNFLALQKAFLHQQELATRHGHEREGLCQQRNTLHRRFVRELLLDMKRLSEAQFPVMVALRQELGLSGGRLDEFRWQMGAQWTRLDAQLDGAIEALEPEGHAALTAGEAARPIEEQSPSALVEAALNGTPPPSSPRG